jgi:hypothetical protein
MLARAIELGPVNIPLVFSRKFDVLGGSTINELLLLGEIDRAAEALERIVEGHPELRIVRIETDG